MKFPQIRPPDLLSHIIEPLSHELSARNDYYCIYNPGCNMLPKRNAPVEMQGSEFKQIGHQLIGQIADFIDNICRKPVTTDASSAKLSGIIGHHSLPEYGTPANEIVNRASSLLFDYSLLNGNPKSLGHITSSAAPIGALADMLAAAVNPNVGAYILSPVATEMKKQVVKWVGEFIAVPACFDGILVSGGNMANFPAFFAAINAKIPETKKEGIAAAANKPLIYCSKTTHTWIEKAASLSGLGANSIRWIPADSANRMDITILEDTMQEDRK